MRMEALIAALILLADCSGSARAELKGLPRFSSTETQTIARNELLNAVVAADPWLVRRMLDVIERNPRQSNADAKTAAGDPDLAVAPRDWQGMVEWNDLIKRARAEKDTRDKPEPAASSRSSEGTVEMIDLMRKAQARKDHPNAP